MSIYVGEKFTINNTPEYLYFKNVGCGTEGEGLIAESKNEEEEI